MQFLSWFCMRRNCSQEVSPAFPQFCSDMTCVCLIPSSAALSFSSWLQATHSSVAYRLRKPKHKHNTKIPPITCERWMISYSEVAYSLLKLVIRPILAWEKELGFRRQSSWSKFHILNWLLKLRKAMKWHGSFVEWNWQADVKVLREEQVRISFFSPQILMEWPGTKHVSPRVIAGDQPHVIAQPNVWLI